MATVPRYTRQIGIPAQSGSVRLDPGIAAGPELGAVLARSLDRLGALAERKRLARQQAQAAALEDAGARALNDLTLAMERDTDFATAPQRFEAEAMAIREGLLHGVEDPAVAQAFSGSFADLFETKRVAVERDAFKRESDTARGGLTASLASALNLAAAASSEQERKLHVGRAISHIDGAAAAGWIGVETGAEMALQFRSDLAETDVRAMITKDPGAAVAALDDPERFQDLSPLARARLADTAASRWDTALNEREAAEARAEKAREKQVKAEADGLLKDAYARSQAGDFTLFDAGEIARHPGVSPAEAKGLYAMADPKTTPRDDPDTVVALIRRLEDPHFLDTAARALQEGRITPDRFVSLTNKSRELTADDRPASPYRAGYRRINDTLAGVGEMFGSAGQSVFKRLQQDALTDFDLWIEANPAAQRAEVYDQVRDIIQRHTAIQTQEMAIALGVPRFVEGGRDAIDGARLDAAEMAMFQASEAGTVTQTQADEQRALIQAWRRVLALREPPQTGAGRPAASGSRSRPGGN